MFRPDTNPRAFPSSAIDDRFGGMTMWDYFAGQALVGLASKDAPAGLATLELRGEIYAKCAALLADAMMEERAKRLPRCPFCDGTGTVHLADGESLGDCNCGAPHA